MRQNLLRKKIDGLIWQSNFSTLSSLIKKTQLTFPEIVKDEDYFVGNLYLNSVEQSNNYDTKSGKFLESQSHKQDKQQQNNSK